MAESSCCLALGDVWSCRTLPQQVGRLVLASYSSAFSTDAKMCNADRFYYSQMHLHTLKVKERVSGASFRCRLIADFDDSNTGGYQWLQSQQTTEYLYNFSTSCVSSRCFRPCSAVKLPAAVTGTATSSSKSSAAAVVTGCTGPAVPAQICSCSKLHSVLAQQKDAHKWLWAV